MNKLISTSDRIYVAGHGGMAGSAICRALQRGGYGQILTAARAELDLLDGPAVQRWFAEHQPTVVALAAAKVGGIQANNSYPADFLLDNLKIQNHVIEAAWLSGVRRLLHLSQVRRPADPGGVPAHRSPRAHECVVCPGQDQWHQALPGPAPAARL
jgi:GDP-L-fucose synthase